MSWFIFALICIFGWGLADLFYKKSSDDTDNNSHLKIAIWVGLVMGIIALCMLPFRVQINTFFAEQSGEDYEDIGFDFVSTLKHIAFYSPASLAYIISMIIGYAGMRYMEASIISPVQNSSGAVAFVIMCVVFCILGEPEKITENIGVLDIIGIVVILVGVIALAVVEKRLENKTMENNKLSHSALALVFPLLYCLFDAIGTAADGFLIDGTYNTSLSLGFGEADSIIVYGLTFFVVAIVCWVILLVKTKKAYNPFTLNEFKTKGIAAIFEEFGQVFYVIALSQNSLVAIPMISSYCIVSVILSRVFLKEKLKKQQYACIVAVIIGIVLLGISEGLAE